MSDRHGNRGIHGVQGHVPCVLCHTLRSISFPQRNLARIRKLLISRSSVSSSRRPKAKARDWHRGWHAMPEDMAKRTKRDYQEG